MTSEVKLKPGWLANDVQKATNRLNQWSEGEKRITTLTAIPSGRAKLADQQPAKKRA